MDPLASPDVTVGCLLRIRTTLGDEVQGHMLTRDKASNIVVIQVGEVGVRGNLRFLKANYIKHCELLKQSEHSFDIKNRTLDVSSLQAREEAALRLAESDAQQIGVGVSKEAQDIFYALRKTLPVSWENNTILVMQEVRVNEPYLPENVTGGTSAANERVRIVLSNERKKLLEARAASQV